MQTFDQWVREQMAINGACELCGAAIKGPGFHEQAVSLCNGKCLEKHRDDKTANCLINMKTEPFRSAEYLDTLERLRAYVREVLEECREDFHVCEKCGHQDNEATEESNLFLLLKDAVR